MKIFIRNKSIGYEVGHHSCVWDVAAAVDQDIYLSGSRYRHGDQYGPWRAGFNHRHLRTQETERKRGPNISIYYFQEVAQGALFAYL